MRLPVDKSVDNFNVNYAPSLNNTATQQYILTKINFYHYKSDNYGRYFLEVRKKHVQLSNISINSGL